MYAEVNRDRASMWLPWEMSSLGYISIYRRKNEDLKYIYILTHDLFIYFFFFFCQGRKMLTFFEHVSTFIIHKDEFDFR